MRISGVCIFSLAFLFSCSGSKEYAYTVSGEDSVCQTERKGAKDSFDKGDFLLPETREYRYGPYVEEAFYKLFHVKPTVPVWNDVVGLPSSCYDKMIDSLITARFGKYAFERAQDYADSLHEADPERYGNDCMYSPTYIPNNDSLYADLRRHGHYPESAKRDSISGVVYLRLDIDVSGAVTNATVMKGVRSDLDSAAVDAAMHLGKFHPQRRWGIMQAGQVMIPIKFTL